MRRGSQVRIFTRGQWLTGTVHAADHKRVYVTFWRAGAKHAARWPRVHCVAC
jgi:hypothetical protein